MITIHNVSKEKPGTDTLNIYCGRNGRYDRHPRLTDARIGNPYDVNTYGRKRCIELFKADLMGRPHTDRWWKVIHRIQTLHHEGKHIRLWCWCAPLACHCDVIKELAQAPLALGKEAE